MSAEGSTVISFYMSKEGSTLTCFYVYGGEYLNIVSLCLQRRVSNTFLIYTEYHLFGDFRWQYLNTFSASAEASIFIPFWCLQKAVSEAGHGPLWAVPGTSP